MKNIIFLPFLTVFLFSCASGGGLSGSLKDAAGKNITVSPAPTAFQDVDRIMKSPGYWISKLKTPDKVILNEKEIEALNSKTVGKSAFIADLRYFPSKYYRKSASAIHKKHLNMFSKYFDGYSGVPVGIDFFENMEKNIDYGQFDKTIDVKFAMTVKYAELRVFPTTEKLFSSLDTLDLDRMQITQLDIASPIAVIYSTKDKQWHYVISEIAEGWLSKDSFAFCKQDVIKDYKRWDKLIVTISPNSDIYKDAEMTDFFDYVKMGAALPLGNVEGDTVEIRIPIAKTDNTLGFSKAYMRLADVSIGYMKYTQRNVLNQAFKHLNSPYGWGGMNGEQDCSSFIRQIFACFGIVMPRNSTGQSQVGIFAGSFETGEPEYVRAQRIIKNAEPAIALIYFPGHIMLYAGHEAQKPYIIHSIWGYGEDTEKESKTYLINRVAITSMNLGDASDKGSLLNRAVLVKNIK
ncbi:MAG: SH3 domain-containing protein [Endomicrobium sp.]|jgi:hypothetical protein|nr:SH3 domain-containing protein [Endomicrobium sp.]